METVQLLRTRTGPQGTFGVISTGDWECCTAELPWKDNQNRISCIPPGQYTAIYIKSSSYGACYWLQEVPGRTEILIHSGNFAGDKSKGWVAHSAGCILLGDRFGVLGDQEAVLLSRKTIRKFVSDVMACNNFILDIQEMF